MSDLLDSSFEVAGKRYGINLTDWDARELKAIGFDVYGFSGCDESLNVVFGTSHLFADVLLMVCKPSDEKEFLQGLNSDAREAAREALKNAIVNFSPASIRQTVLEQFAAIQKMITEPELVTANEQTS